MKKLFKQISYNVKVMFNICPHCNKRLSKELFGGNLICPTIIKMCPDNHFAKESDLLENYIYDNGGKEIEFLEK